jgi:hypothetical protein
MPLYGDNMPTVAMFEGIKIQFFNAEHRHRIFMPTAPSTERRSTLIRFV